jgi:hypothetical protein
MRKIMPDEQFPHAPWTIYMQPTVRVYFIACSRLLKVVMGGHGYVPIAMQL